MQVQVRARRRRRRRRRRGKYKGERVSSRHIYTSLRIIAPCRVSTLPSAKVLGIHREWQTPALRRTFRMRPATASVVANAVTRRFVNFGTRRSIKPTHTRRPLLLNRRMATTPVVAASDAAATAPVPIVQYVVLRRDLGEESVLSFRSFLSVFA